MAVLGDGQKFGLSSKSQTNRSVIYVKLTDSALKSIEDYLKNKAVVDSRQGPSLQFTDNGGIICLPQGDRGSHEYSFGLSNEEGGPHKQGRTDYLMSANSDSGPTLTSLGSMAEILRVKATNDSFRRIGEKFTNVKLENERNSTVLLDKNNKDKKRASVPKTQVTRRVVSSGVVNNVPSSRMASSSPGQSFSGPGRGTLPSSRPGSPMSRPAPAPAPARSPVFSQSVSSHPPHPPQPAQPRNSYQQTHAQKPAPSRPSVNTEIMKRPLRERLIHLLAVRTYKKPELYIRMHKDGMKDKEKKLLNNILREVSDSRNNVYELRRSMWNEVAEDWPFYSEQDKAALRRRKPQNLTPPGSDTGSTSSGHSPSSTNPPSPPHITNPMRKRDNTYYESQQEIGPVSKRKRTSNFKRTGPGTSWDQSGVSLSPGLDMEYDKVEDDSAPDWNRWGQNEHQPPPPPEPTPPAPAPPQSVSPVSVQSNSQMQPAPNKNMDFLSTYTNITSQEQRTKYKAEFNQYYAKYMKLHNVLDQVSKRFALLEGKLKHAQKGSEEFKNVKARILQEYERNKQDRMYQDARNNFQYLHEKLAHIKKLVHDYDTARVAVR